MKVRLCQTPRPMKSSSAATRLTRASLGGDRRGEAVSGEAIFRARRLSRGAALDHRRETMLGARTHGPFPLQRKLPRGQLYLPDLRRIGLALVASLAAPSRGPRVDALEARFAAALESRHAVLLSHARVALLAILRALDLPPGSEVLMTPVTIPDVVNAVLVAGLRPVFVDLAERTCNVDPVALAARVTPASRVILVTHLSGLASPMDEILRIAKDHGLVILEDGSQAMGTRHGGKMLGTFGKAGFYSLSTLKPVASFHGGLAITDDAALAAALRDAARAMPLPSRSWLFKMFARDAILHAASHPLPFSLAGYYGMAALERLAPAIVDELQRGNLVYDGARRAARVKRKTELAASFFTAYTEAQAVIAEGCLDALDPGNHRRGELVARLHGQLAAASVPGLVRTDPLGSPTFWRYPIWTADPEALRASLRRRGIDAARTNLCCASREPAFAEYAAHTPNAVAFVDGMVFLPLHPNLDAADMDHLASAVIDHFRGAQENG
ncbi:MAG: DegT/DnrJ/EryC1/StrS family aminotransferase [Byssovorax sp.]